MIISTPLRGKGIYLLCIEGIFIRLSGYFLESYAYQIFFRFLNIFLELCAYLFENYCVWSKVRKVGKLTFFQRTGHVASCCINGHI